MKNQLLLKILCLLVTLALLMFGLSLIQDVVRDRIRNQGYAVQSVVDSLAGPQTLMGPILVQICTETTSTKNGTKLEYSTREFQRLLLPDELKHSAKASMDERSRGLHHVNTYALGSEIKAIFHQPSQYQKVPEASVPGAVVRCGKMRVAIALSDPRGIRSAKIFAAGKQLDVESGTPLERYSRGFQAEIPADALSTEKSLEVLASVDVVGTQSLAFVPLGVENRMSLSADWPHPSFGGSFLPERREVSDSGFDASWTLSSLATSARQAFVQQTPVCINTSASSAVDDVVEHTAVTAMAGSRVGPCLETMVTQFIDPVNPYVLSDRATKYGVLFIVLTFVAVGLFEVLKRLRVHPVQYFLVGSALCSFFLLLLSFSEHFGFATAYAIAASACVLLLAYYASHILGSVRRGLPFAAGITSLFGLLFLLLQLEQTALIVGAIALFAVLALVMVCTRNVDWYGFNKLSETASERESAVMGEGS